jgi:methionyl-tRNA formyltransferase
MRIVFAGSPAIAVPSLEALAAAFTVVGVLTNPDRKKGRGKQMSATEVKIKALELGIPVIQHEHLYRQAREEIAALQPDLLVSFAYGRIFGPRFLSLFPLGGVNVHPSLLPSYRGCAPIQAAILSGDRSTGITIQKIALKMDTGDILSQLPIGLDGRETTETLSDTVSHLSPELLVRTLKEYRSSGITPVAQDDGLATYCTFVDRSDALIDWSDSASKISSAIRAYYPWPKAFTHFHDRVLMLTYALPYDGELPGVPLEDTMVPGMVLGASGSAGLIVATGSGLLGVTRLQLQSKKEMDWKAFMNGNPGIIGSLLS